MGDRLTPVVGAVWNFHYSSSLVFYPKLDLGFGIGKWSTNSGYSEPDYGGGLFFQGAVGAVYRTGKPVLRAEVGSGQLRLGAAFSF